jgi:hypothetical protein
LKLLDTIKRRLINTVAGVTVHYVKADEYTISFVVMKLVKGKTQIIDSESGSDMEVLLQKLDKSIPVWLTVTGRTVITRKLNTDPGDNYLNHILHNAKESDFRVSFRKTSRGEVVVSAVRNEHVEEMLKNFQEHSFSVIGLSIGPSPLILPVELDLLKDSSVSVPGYILNFQDRVLKEILTDENLENSGYRIGDELIQSPLLLSFTTAFSYLLSHEGADQLVTGSYVTNDNEFSFKLLNKYLLFGSLGLIFILLLINFMGFSYYNKRQQAISELISYQEGFFVKRDSLRKEIALKTGLIKKAGLSEDTRYGFYIDRIAAAIPDGISLTECTVNPLIDKMKPEKPVQLNKFISISGVSSGSITLNEWIDSLNKYQWIKDIEIINYKKKDSKGEFEIKILY